MKKLLMLFCLTMLVGCEKIPSGVTDVHESSYQVTGYRAPSSFVYAKGDSSFSFSLKFNSGTDIKQVWADIYSPEDDKLNSEPVMLLDNGSLANGDTLKGDNVYSGKFSLSSKYSNGKYRIDYYVLSSDGITRKVAVHSFSYDNKQTDYPPMISDLVMPDTVSAGEKFTFTVKVSDPNGLNDIKSVSFYLINKEDGSTTQSFNMVDDGNLEVFGDAVVGDGIYSYKNSFSSSAKGKTREFVFQAIDKSDSLSNIITHNIYVK